MSSYQQYQGEVVSVDRQGQYGFIGLSSVHLANGQPHELGNVGDIFVHQNDVDTTLHERLIVAFDVEPDQKRGGNYLRAVRAIAMVAQETLPAIQPIPGFHVVVPTGQSFKLTAYHAKMKLVPENVVAQVEVNQPLPNIPRGDFGLSTENTQKYLEAFLTWLFPTLVDYGADFNIGQPDDTVFTETLQSAIASHRNLGMNEQVAVLEEEAARFGKTRSALNLLWSDGVARPGSIIPVENLPDLFMAVPVWYHYMKPNSDKAKSAGEAITSEDPRVHPNTVFFCDLLPGNQRWADIFQMFNRRTRTIGMYKGDIIPPHVHRRLKEATDIFDHVVIATPYLEEAGKDWQDLDWLRSIDPYVLGFIKGSPVFYVVARFSNSGTFPLYNQMVGDTIEFLRANIEKLRGYDRVHNPFWYNTRDRGSLRSSKVGVGEHLIRLTTALLQAFDEGNLFNWIRESQPATTQQS